MIKISKHHLDLAEVLEVVRHAALFSSSSMTRARAESTLAMPTWVCMDLLLLCNCEYAPKLRQAIEHFRAQPYAGGVYVTIGGHDARDAA